MWINLDNICKALSIKPGCDKNQIRVAVAAIAAVVAIMAVVVTTFRTLH